jgi:hypothetical protein
MAAIEFLETGDLLEYSLYMNSSANWIGPSEDLPLEYFLELLRDFL